MKRLIFSLIIALCIVTTAIPAWAVTGSVSLANIRLSLVDGVAFVDFSAANTLTPYINWKLTLTDSAGKKATGFIKAAGTGETYGPELLDAWTNSGAYPFETFTVSGSDITQAINDAGNLGLALKALSSSTGKLYRCVSATYTLNSGTAPNFGLADTSSNMTRTFTKGGITYGQGAANAVRLIIINSGVAACDFALTGTSLKQVLTPSATGVTITSTPGGTTYNWTSIDAAFNYNDSSGYTYTLTAPPRGGMFLGMGFCF